jgi:hypothetical protein
LRAWPPLRSACPVEGFDVDGRKSVGCATVPE